MDNHEQGNFLGTSYFLVEKGEEPNPGSAYAFFDSEQDAIEDWNELHLSQYDTLPVIPNFDVYKIVIEKV